MRTLGTSGNILILSQRNVWKSFVEILVLSENFENTKGISGNTIDTNFEKHLEEYIEIFKFCETFQDIKGTSGIVIQILKNIGKVL